MAESEADDDSEPSQVDELRAMVEALTAQMAAQSAELTSLKGWKAGLEQKVAQDPELKEQLFGQPTLSPVE